MRQQDSSQNHEIDMGVSAMRTKAKTPNHETVQAIKEVEELKTCRDKKVYSTFSDVLKGMDLNRNTEDTGVERTNRGIEAIKQASRIAQETGISDMTLDEINPEISGLMDKNE